jgi:hypothetical protein
VAVAAAELRLEPEVVKRDVAQLLLQLETLMEKRAAERAGPEAGGEAEPHGEVAAPASIEVSPWEKRGSAGMGRRRQPKTPQRCCLR